VAADAAQNLKASGLLRDKTVVLLGTKVRDAFKFGTLDPLKMNWSYRNNFAVTWIPHPRVPQERYYRDPENVETVREFLKGVVNACMG
jgi:hypothetical protein